MRPGHVLDDVLEEHQLVGRVLKGVELVVDLALAGRADLVVRALHLQPDLKQLGDHVVADVGEVVDRRYGEVAALVAGLVAAVAALLDASGVPRALDGVDVVVRLVLVRVEAHVVEHVELGLGAEVDGVGEAGRLEVRLGVRRDVARIASIRLVGERVADREVHDQGLRRAERVDERRGRVRDELHVGLVDRLEAADRGSVEHQPVVEDGLVEGLHRDVEVLHDAGQVDEADIHELDVGVLDVLQDLVGTVEHDTSCSHGEPWSCTGWCVRLARELIPSGRGRSPPTPER